MKNSALWELLLVFAPLSLLTIGGGQTILADLQLQSVSIHHWLTPDQFLDDFAISRAAPGPGTLIVTLIGWQVAGIAGAAITSLAIFLPSSLLFYGVTIAWRRHAGSQWQERLSQGLAPVSVGLVLAASYAILVANGDTPLAWIVSGLSAVALLRTRVHPLILLAGGGAAFLVQTYLAGR